MECSNFYWYGTRYYSILWNAFLYMMMLFQTWMLKLYPIYTVSKYPTLHFHRQQYMMRQNWVKKMEIFTFGDIERTRLHQYESIEEPYISIQNQFQYNPGFFLVPSNYSTYYFVFIVYELFLMLILIAIGAYYFYFCWKIFFEAFVLYIYYI